MSTSAVKESLLIGVLAKKNEDKAVQELFELFKTPWEYYDAKKSYEIVLSSDDPGCEIDAKLLIIYGSEENAFDRQHHFKPVNVESPSSLQYKGFVFPIYGNISSFRDEKKALITVITTVETDDVVAVRYDTAQSKVIRVGFDLFKEIGSLLRQGQPLPYAQIPTLDLHITMLRDWIIDAGILLVEVPSCPAGFDFTVCLTHDVDFLRIRDHVFDHTMFGFLYRASMGSFFSLLQGKISLGRLLKNWRAVCLLPGVYLKIVNDYFFQFDNYLEIEQELPSTFFILPFKNKPGVDKMGQVQHSRAARYDIDDIHAEISKLLSAGREIALHGIDAWREPAKGREEFERISRVVGTDRIGIRSHWLYQCDQSPRHLEEAGFAYESSAGFNETIGYRNGTTQVFCPPGATTLLELPLHIMDTALFYPNYLDLAEPDAMDLVKSMTTDMQRFGGVLTLNWHHRSLGPERLWDDFYRKMLSHLKSMNVWFATAQQAVSWFSTRRSVSFYDVHLDNNELKIRLSSRSCDDVKLLLRVYIPQSSAVKAAGSFEGEPRLLEVPFSGNLNVSIPL